MTGTEIFKRTDVYEREARDIRLHAPQWQLLLAFDGQRTLAEVALSAEVPFVEALPLTERFLKSNWIAEQPITLEQYLKRSGAANLSTIGAAIPPATVLHGPKPETPSATTPLVAAPAVTAAPSAPVKRGPMRLSAVVDFLLNAAGHSSVGQLLVYRVFLRVPPELLQRAEIETVQLKNDNSLIRDESLQEAIASAVSALIQRPLPESVFSPA
jgi:hypothetical protein